MTSATSSALEPAQLNWDEQGRPESALFGDVYFSRANGLAETQYVFLQQNHLHQRWQQADLRHFTIAETGFGTGLNFLCAWQLWRQLAPAEARLHFVSVEKFPLRLADLQQALALWPELAELSAPLLQHYPCNLAGFHRLQFDQGRVTLTLMLGDAIESYQRLDAQVDAWFLDGFAPAKNPQMWQPELFQQLARLSHAHTSFSTFTAAGIVKRGLQAVGFQVEKVPGFGHKRDMLRGHFQAEMQTHTHTPQRALIIGAGIAGASCAHALAQAGWQVEVYEQAPAPAQGASGNPQGVLYLKLPKFVNLSSQLHCQGLLYSRHLLRQHLADEQGQSWQECGVIQLALHEKDRQRQLAALSSGIYPHEFVHAVEAEQASQLAQINLNQDGLYYPLAGWVNPPRFCQRLLQHDRIRCHYNSLISRITFHQGQWHLFQGQQLVAQAPVLVVCNASAATTFAPCQSLPLGSIRGQVSYAKVEQLPQPGPVKVICQEGYISPARDNHYCFGASFDRSRSEAEWIEADQQENLARLGRMLPDWYDSCQTLQLQQGRASVRSTTPDHLPLVGELQPGLFLSLGHGSKGLITAPLAAEIIASQLSHAPSPVPRELSEALSPLRYQP
ncbi:bifunctional tRNA (5-methylaminomethyl-2-thiouridine)(34)-methyltransferase MnmD/FAD-dependent 5-carboxymethylaminomethyl-2-thiouridine(34) oxidoreductase MnmC [Balneatrix alpica]|uniref:bifunctional tRNA (5-methylaminomethyl-2-thiouridine)(34)-methyltransferase MnmD/FAD-dependent 5-carboxymethylaminomethyl-2-thiouridine(34) oxidoreductase MnmC n=1 Tax=Balneatrix alpica TaxID=75684 RepID=UPI002739F477|nr:bifunctional tRNA (5-methylaminomethyl-2-thiouridine)(34)-methyltransferase MnmD/FAD-dependent 5-carboxymethylaminomethyl-2-thiouridine(34) oxidoreductase MnmC [Balneatrix alpica]